ncbi:hypothetical protein Tco_0238187 [Tanacetum coccineum]
MAILNVEIAKLKAEAVAKKNSGPTELVKPKVLASMMYTKSSKYIVPPKRANWVQPTLLPKKKQVTFQDPHRSSPRPAQKPQVQQHKKPTVPVNFVVHSTKSVHVKTHQAKCTVNPPKIAWKAPRKRRCETLYLNGSHCVIRENDPVADSFLLLKDYTTNRYKFRQIAVTFLSGILRDPTGLAVRHGEIENLKSMKEL